jgi:hypothetical protein
MMNMPRCPAEAEHFVRSTIYVSPEMITEAKQFMLSQAETNVDHLIVLLVDHAGTRDPGKVVVNQSVDFMPDLENLSRRISWHLAGCQAIWELIHANERFPASTHLTGDLGYISWTTIIPGSGGERASWNFTDLSLRVPAQIAVPPSVAYGSKQ